MAEGQMSWLYNHPKIKALINLSHGECYGLPMFEASYYGLPVIATEFGGQVDFLRMPIKDKKSGDIENKNMFAVVKHDMALIQKEAVWNGVLHQDSAWAYPNHDSAREKMRDVYLEWPRFKSMADKLKKHNIEKYDEQKINKMFVETILGKEIKIIKNEDIPKISIFTSVFNCADELEVYLKNIETQTIFDKLEWVMVHPKDSPTFEKECEILAPYLGKYENIKYFVNEEKDEGVYDGWSRGVNLCTGEFIGNRNVGDILAPDQLEKMAKELMMNDDVGLVYCDSYITMNGNETWEKNSSEGKRYNMPQYSFDNMKIMNLPHNCPLYRRELHEKFGNYDKSFQFAGDYDMFLKFAAGGIKFKKMDDVLGLYHHSATGVTTNPARFKEKRVEEKSLYMKYKDVKI
jgi:hypothetical protein